jgi:hypothetical protein
MSAGSPGPILKEQCHHVIPWGSSTVNIPLHLLMMLEEYGNMCILIYLQIEIRA